MNEPAPKAASFLKLSRDAVRRWLPPTARDRLEAWVVDRKVRRSSDRRHMRQVLIPALGRHGGNLLFVGCRRYTAAYPDAFARGGATCWTLDIDPDAACWGAKGRHVVAGVEASTSVFAPGFFQTIVLSGVFGFGVDGASAQTAALDACASILAEGGLLILGWNTDRVADPSALPALSRWYRPAGAKVGLADRTTFPDGTHVYDVLERLPDPRDRP
ncbi:MAG: hypothetical protein RQ966_04625 [Acetobacteraceae bacterium]|nr:hypothetical protein [Acetobacteraceae bacterium]